MNQTKNRKLVAALLAVSLACAPLPVLAASSSSAPQGSVTEAGTDFGVGLFAVLANVVYMPVKVVYGVLGGITGSLAFVLSGGNKEVAYGVWVPSLGGDYVLTPGMMTGREEFHFNGVRQRTTSHQGPDDDLGSTF